jgi:hypothetical protein
LLISLTYWVGMRSAITVAALEVMANLPCAFS